MWAEQSPRLILTLPVEWRFGSATSHQCGRVAAAAKMLIAGLVVLAIVLAVAYWFNHRFNA